MILPVPLDEIGKRGKKKPDTNMRGFVALRETWKQGVCQTVALPFTLKSILRQKTNYGNSNISPCKNIILKKKSSKRNQNPSRDIITL